MVVSYLESNITWLNVFPKKNGIYKTLSPSTIVLGTLNIDTTHATVQPGSYANFKIKARITNNMKTRRMAKIILRRSNKRGGHYFMSLNMGRRLHSYQWQELPITQSGIDCLEEMDTADEATEIIDGYPNFEWTPGNPITDCYKNE